MTDSGAGAARHDPLSSHVHVEELRHRGPPDNHRLEGKLEKNFSIYWLSQQM
jgi:hypothetical protein